MRRVGGNGTKGMATPNTVPTQGTAVAPPLTTEKPVSRMNLASIGKSISSTAEKIVLYAPEGWGKTTWASKAEAPIFISTEGGLKAVTVDAFPEPQTWQEILDAIETLRREDHKFKTLVIDTADWTEHLVQSYLLNRDHKISIEDYGYGKGYVMSCEEWKRLIAPIESLRREKNMNVIFLAHTAIRTFNNPSGENFDRWEMKTDRRISALLKEWADCVLFGNYDVAVDVKKGQTKGKGYGGERIIYANHSPAWDAKNRYGITEPLPAEFAEFWKKAKGEKNEN